MARYGDGAPAIALETNDGGFHLGVCPDENKSWSFPRQKSRTPQIWLETLKDICPVLVPGFPGTLTTLNILAEVWSDCYSRISCEHVYNRALVSLQDCRVWLCICNFWCARMFVHLMYALACALARRYRLDGVRGRCQGTCYRYRLFVLLFSPASYGENGTQVNEPYKQRTILRQRRGGRRLFVVSAIVRRPGALNTRTVT